MAGKRIYTLNENYFEKIDNGNKAYFLGFLYSDGNVYMKGYENAIRIGIQIDDIDILREFSKLIGTNRPIGISKKLIGKNQAIFSTSSKKICQDLIKLGCFQKKSKILKFPTTEQVPNRFIHHFIRGYFDGDGCVWEGKRYKAIVKDKTKLSGFREKMIHNVKFNLTGTIDLIQGIQNVLIDNQVINKTEINKSKKIYNCVQLEYSGRIQMKKFYNYIYKESLIFLKRKKCKFESIINLC